MLTLISISSERLAWLAWRSFPALSVGGGGRRKRSWRYWLKPINRAFGFGDVARRHDIYPAQIRLWRKTLSHFDVSASFLPVHLVNEISLGQMAAAGGAPVLIKIQLRNGRSLKVPADLERKTLSSLIACVEAA